MRVKIEAVSRKERLSKSGKPYISVGIKVGEEWLSGFQDPINELWRNGDEVEIEVEEKDGFKNFRALNPIQALETRIAALEKEVFNKNNKEFLKIEEDMPF